MLTALEIENFKAFGERQRVELRPITMLFGPNSGGKSSVTHALHYLSEVLVRGNLDVHRTWSGGDVVDLGGIGNFVHGRTRGTPIRLKAEFDLAGADIPDYFDPLRIDELYAAIERDDVEERIRGLIHSAGVEIEIDTAEPATVSRLRIDLNGKQIAEIAMGRDRKYPEVQGINWHHPVLLLDAEDEEIAGLHARMTDKLGELAKRTGQDRTLKPEDIGGTLAGALAGLFEQAGHTPTSGLGLQFELGSTILPDLEKPLWFPIMANRDGADQIEGAHEFSTILSTLILGPVAVLRKRLERLAYVGPLRAMPPRYFEPRGSVGGSRWPTGLQAWETIADASADFVDEVSKWLDGSDHLDTGYRVEKREVRSVPDELLSLLLEPENVDKIDFLQAEVKKVPRQVEVRLRDVERNLAMHPRDIGVGLSQLVPVLVALLDGSASIVALEQPELHLHPRQQAAIGDALIRGVQRSTGRILIIETHSEHLILRLLRRIRESTKGQGVAQQRLSPEQLRVQYVRREGTASSVDIIEVDVNGDFVDPWPDDFFEQDFKERFS